MFDNINQDNYIIYAMKYYDKPNYILSEFDEDMKRFNYLIKLFIRYDRSNELRERLILNHLIILFNVFEDATVRLLFFRIPEDYYKILKTFLVFLDRMPSVVTGVLGKNIISSNISLDMEVVKILRGLK